MLDDRFCRRTPRTARKRMGHVGTLACLVAFAGLSGCFGSGKQAGDQLRSALSFDSLPEQYEPDVEDAEDFGDE